MAAILALLLALLQPPDPGLTARWDSPTSAVVSWQQGQRGCLWRNSTFIGCYDGAGAVRVTFGQRGPMDAAYRPAAGDVFTVVVDGAAYSAPLRSVVRLPVVWT